MKSIKKILFAASLLSCLPAISATGPSLSSVIETPDRNATSLMVCKLVGDSVLTKPALLSRCAATTAAPFFKGFAPLSEILSKPTNNKKNA